MNVQRMVACSVLIEPLLPVPLWIYADVNPTTFIDNTLVKGDIQEVHCICYVPRCEVSSVAFDVCCQPPHMVAPPCSAYCFVHCRRPIPTGYPYWAQLPAERI